MHPLKKMGIYTMQDLLDFDLKNFRPILLKQWESILFYDATSLYNIKNKYEYNNPKYWIDLKPNNFKYHCKRLQKLTREKNGTIKKDIYKLIDKKISILNTF